MMDQIEEKFLDTQPGEFNSIDHALIVAASALQYLAAQCEVKEEKGTGALPPKEYEAWTGKTPAEIEELMREGENEESS